MNTTEPSKILCPTCTVPHLNINAQGAATLFSLGLPLSDIEPLFHAGDDAALYQPPPHRTVTRRDELALSRLGLTSYEIEGIRLESARLLASSRDEDLPPDLGSVETLEEALTMLDTLTENTRARKEARETERRAELNRERQRRFKERRRSSKSGGNAGHNKV